MSAIPPPALSGSGSRVEDYCPPLSLAPPGSPCGSFILNKQYKLLFTKVKLDLELVRSFV
jgi:hypothetical protein